MVSTKGREKRDIFLVVILPRRKARFLELLLLVVLPTLLLELLLSLPSRAATP